MDLADGHIAALRKLFTTEDIGELSLFLFLYIYMDKVVFPVILSAFTRIATTLIINVS